MAGPVVVDYRTSKFRLNNGTEMPAVGLGTYRIIHESDIMKTVDYALEAGYRMFDTAAVYRNEIHLGKAFKTFLPKYGLDRKDIFITTKLSPSDHGKKEIIENAIEKSLKNLGLEYVDLYLIHFPGNARLRAEDPRNRALRIDTWRAMEHIYQQGKAKAIGVSNFTQAHLEHLLETRPSIVPAVNQVEWHPYYHQMSLLEYCKQQKIYVQAYCSFGGVSSAIPSLFEENVVKTICKEVNASAAQVLLVWALQNNVAVIPKSTNKDRIRENITLNFKLSEKQMQMLNALSKKGTKFAWDPTPVA